MLLDVSKPKESRIALLKSENTEAFQQLLQKYWHWYYNDSLQDAVRLLLSTDLGWENVPKNISSPVGDINSPLGHALAHKDNDIRDAALHILDATLCIPAGTALIGEECVPIDVEQFEIGVYPVTNAQYLRFILDTDYEPPKDWQENSELNYEIYSDKGDHPVVWVSCEDADAYADYIGGRLPTFEEWQYASRGTDDRLFPWGNEIDIPRCNTAELGAEGTTPVGMFKDGVSPFGCYDMLGNVWEWTKTPYDEKGDFHVACGGAWYYNHDYSTCISFDFFSRDYAEFVIGFRITR